MGFNNGGLLNILFYLYDESAFLTSFESKNSFVFCTCYRGQKGLYHTNKSIY